MSFLVFLLCVQSRTQSPRAFWSAGERPERLWNNGLHFPRKRGFRSFCACLSLNGNGKEKTVLTGEIAGLKCSRNKTFGLTHHKGNWRNDHQLAVRSSEDKTSDAFGKCIFNVSACIPPCRIPSCKQHDRQIFVEATPMSSSTTGL